MTARSSVNLSSSRVYTYLVDANKNVVQLVDANGAIAAHYEYGPFGKVSAQTDVMAVANPFQFSSEFFDAEYGFVYYNYRYYSPEIGRWLSKDPVEEKGGCCLYSYCQNDSVNKYDRLGLIPPPPSLFPPVVGVGAGGAGAGIGLVCSAMPCYHQYRGLRDPKVIKINNFRILLYNFSLKSSQLSFL